MSFNPSPVGSWNEKVMDDACLLEAKRFSGLKSHRGVARGSHPTNTGLQQSSLKSILGDASLPIALH